MALFTIALLLMLGAGFKPAIALTPSGPWPPAPLVTDCDVMPYIARDASLAAPGIVTCTSGPSQSYCDTITCSVLSNLDQIDLELLPCWQHPAIWFKVRHIHGKDYFQDIFDSPKVVNVTIGGGPVMLNVTVIQNNGLTLGFMVVGTIQTDSGPKNVTFAPYRDIPINQTACFPDPTYPTACEFLKLAEQYVLTYYANMTNSLEMMPSCELPNRKSCGSGAKCTWSMDNWSATLHLLYCSKPEIIVSYVDGDPPKTLFNMTFTKSETMKVVENLELKVTLDDVDSKTVGIEVDIFSSGKQHVLVPYATIPIVCDTPTLEQAVMLEEQFPSSNSKGNKRSIIRPYDKPLVTTCEMMYHLAQSATGVANISCSVVNTNCSMINCTLPTTQGYSSTLQLKLRPCFNPVPVIEVKVYNHADVPSFSKIFYHSGSYPIEVDNQTFPFKFTVKQHPSHSSVGLQIAANTSVNSSQVLFSVPYHEIPVNVSECTQAPSKSATCQVMSDVAQYLVVFFANLTHSFESTPDCNALLPYCTTISCALPMGGGYYNFTILPCTKPTPEFQAVVTRSNGSTLFKRTAISSETVKYNSLTTARLTFETNLTSNYVELGLFVTISDFSYELPVIPTVYVPLPDASKCASMITTEPTPTEPPSVNIQLLIEILVPVTALLLLVILISACVAIVVCIRRRHPFMITRHGGRTRVLHFQPMTLSYDTDDEEEEEDDYDDD